MLIGPAHTHRYRRFADTLTDAHARLAEKRGWLVLRFSGLSPPVLHQLAWRTTPAPARPCFSQDLAGSWPVEELLSARETRPSYASILRRTFR